MLGNSNKDGTINPDKNISLKLNSVNKEPCDSCADVKARQKIVPKKIEHKPETNKGACIYIYMEIKTPKNCDVTVTKPHWEITVGE